VSPSSAAREYTTCNKIKKEGKEKIEREPHKKLKERERESTPQV
jgi:hypothetical protein